ncbi:hypothetical protein IFO70_14965 [Phormidium tenue FACHB-886]|nr:hypothetical protein [Phormidium tenue FACHB-886]
MNTIYSPVSATLQQTLDRVAAQAADRKDEVVQLLNDEQPAKSRLVNKIYQHCMWWEGCYYCQDEAQRWYQVKCFR